MILNFNGLQALNKSLDQRDLEGFLTHSMQLILKVSTAQEFKGKGLFVPELDAMIQQTAQAIPTKIPDNYSQVMVHVATEVYDSGGHTRTLEDVVGSLPEVRHILILTDISNAYRFNRIPVQTLKARFDSIGLEVMILQAPTLSAKTIELSSLIGRIAPRCIMLHAHAFDVIANVAITGKSAPRVLYIHHMDHNPSLGATRKDYIHVDNTPPCHHFCKSYPGLSPVFLGLTVKDNGVVTADNKDSFIGATCGHHGKFQGQFLFTYGQILGQLFASGVDRFYHIGAVSEVQKNNICAEIKNAGHDSEKLIFYGGVLSLAETLKEIAPHFYLGSYPVSGGRSAVEALSVGLPFLLIRPPESSPLLCVETSLGAAVVAQSLADIAERLERIRKEGKKLAKLSREHFDRYYAPAIFRQKLLALLNGETFAPITDQQLAYAV